ncbi:Protein lethal(2)essential for life [Strongyloides ratti]|uniref:Protein lethal(2)essential for life n=1 Tax=Strongyloides ratti TaxID=34506 RepID=A0A090L7B1_STRRB|nr:Protein lethal(2)essential for life [Strongyloides ratti]CEF63399.1 Protein lethal(2)essential for life [Strongyloides ratti]
MTSRSILPRLPLSHTFSPFFENRRFFEDLDFDRSFSRPYWHDKPLLESQKFGEGYDEIKVSDDSFSLSFDVSHFEPSELKVNIIDGNVVIEGCHDEKIDKFGSIKRTFVRKYALPQNIAEEDVISELSKDGILTIEGKKKMVNEGKIRNIPINRK